MNFNNFMEIMQLYPTLRNLCNYMQQDLYATICNKTYVALQLYATIWRIGPKALFFLSSHGTHLETYSYYENVPMVPNETILQLYSQILVSGQMQLYCILCNYMQLYRILCNYMQLMQLYASILQLTQLYCNYMQLYCNLCNYMKLYATYETILQLMQLYATICNYIATISYANMQLYGTMQHATYAT